MSQGWIKLHRQIADSAVWQDDGLFRTFTLLLFMASHKPRQVVFPNWNEPINLNPGDIVTSRQYIAERSTALAVIATDDIALLDRVASSHSGNPFIAACLNYRRGALARIQECKTLRARIGELEALVKGLEAQADWHKKQAACVSEYCSSLIGKPFGDGHMFDAVILIEHFHLKAISRARAEEREALLATLDDDNIHQAVKAVIDYQVNVKSIVFQDACETHGRDFVGDNEHGEEHCQECAADGFSGSLGSYDSTQLAVDVVEALTKAIRARKDGGK